MKLEGISPDFHHYEKSLEGRRFTIKTGEDQKTEIVCESQNVTDTEVAVKEFLKNLFVYAGTEHPHQAQNPKTLQQ
ncbi:MAG: hypothetical protein EOP53_20490 [Sphingobacteriales bacterium]|nr:MAG: hypothetical protein EOP53_20490 [Sphingobacteriales bacterium]